MSKEKNRKETPLVDMTKEEREQAWDDLYEKEEGMILEFDSEQTPARYNLLKTEVSIV